MRYRSEGPIQAKLSGRKINANRRRPHFDDVQHKLLLRYATKSRIHSLSVSCRGGDSSPLALPELVSCERWGFSGGLEVSDDNGFVRTCPRSAFRSLLSRQIKKTSQKPAGSITSPCEYVLTLRNSVGEDELRSEENKERCLTKNVLHYKYECAQNVT